MAIIFLPQRFIALNIPAGRGRYEAAHAHAAKVATAIAATVRPMTDREFCAFMWQIERELLKHAPMTSGCKHGTRACKRNVVRGQRPIRKFTSKGTAVLNARRARNRRKSKRKLKTTPVLG